MTSIADNRIRFICCRHTYHLGEQIQTDSEGYMVCPKHGMRRYGWRSVPHRAWRSVAHGLANSGETVMRPDFRRSTLEVDRDVQTALAEHLTISPALKAVIEEYEVGEIELR